MDERWTSDGAFDVCAPRLPGATAGDSQGDSGRVAALHPGGWSLLDRSLGPLRSLAPTTYLYYDSPRIDRLLSYVRVGRRIW